MEFQQKQIWLINYDPSFGHEYQKMRPGLIVEHNIFIQKYDLLTIIPISSITINVTELDILIPKSTVNRLLKDSIIKTKQINTFDKRRFIKFIGICDDIIYEEVKNNILLYLD